MPGTKMKDAAGETDQPTQPVDLKKKRKSEKHAAGKVGDENLPETIEKDVTDKVDQSPVSAQLKKKKNAIAENVDESLTKTVEKHVTAKVSQSPVSLQKKRKSAAARFDDGDMPETPKKDIVTDVEQPGIIVSVKKRKEISKEDVPNPAEESAAINNAVSAEVKKKKKKEKKINKGAKPRVASENGEQRAVVGRLKLKKKKRKEQLKIKTEKQPMKKSQLKAKTRDQRDRYLSKIMFPKSLIKTVFELIPGVRYFGDRFPTDNQFSVDLIQRGTVLASTTGATLYEAKKAAAEIALKNYIKKTVVEAKMKAVSEAIAENKEDGSSSKEKGSRKRKASNTSEEVNRKKTKVDAEEKQGPGEVNGEASKELPEESIEESFEKLVKNPAKPVRQRLPWRLLMCYALHELLSKWKKEGLEVIPLKKKVPEIQEKPCKMTEVICPTPRLPGKVEKLHAITIINSMFPGLFAVQLERTESSVTYAYQINGKKYTGTARKGRVARFIAAYNYMLQEHNIKCMIPPKIQPFFTG